MLTKIKELYLYFRKYIFLIVSILLLFVFVKLIYSNSELVTDGVYVLQDASKAWILISIIIFSLIVPFTALIFETLSFKKLPRVLTLKVQVASLFVNKILPSGLGQLTLNSYYLHTEGNTKTQTASILTTRAITSGFALIFMLLIFIFLNLQTLITVLNDYDFDNFSFEKYFLLLFIFIIFVVVLLFVLKRNIKLEEKITNPFINYKYELLKYRNHPEKIVISIFLSILIAFTGIFTIWASAKSVGVDLMFAEAIFLYYFSIFAASVIPIPGGIGTIEIGLSLAFYALGYDPLIFISIIIIYRVINYWLPIIIGFIFFLNLRKNVLRKFTLKYDKSDKIAISSGR